MKLAARIVDTEADGQRDYGAPLTARYFVFWPPVRELGERHGVTPTCLLTTEIILDALLCVVSP